MSNPKTARETEREREKEKAQHATRRLVLSIRIERIEKAILVLTQSPPVFLINKRRKKKKDPDIISYPVRPYSC